MKPDITIEEAYHSLHAPKKYLEGLLVHMRSCALAHGNALVRIGASSKSTGQYPCYRVIYNRDGAEKIFGSFWDSHKAFAEPYDKVTPGDWSTSATEMNKVIALATASPEKLDAHRT